MLNDDKYNKAIGFLLGEKYRLELHWSGLLYKDKTCFFKGAYFSGPVLQFAERIEDNNFILLDLYKQYFVFSEAIYLVKLSWGKVSYKKDNNCVFLDQALIEFNPSNTIPKLRKSDYLVINTQGHDRETHTNYPTYTGIVVNREGAAYNFWKVHKSFKRG